MPVVNLFKDIKFATMLLERFKAAENEDYLWHSGIAVEAKIETLQDLVDRYVAIADKEAVLAKIIAKRPTAGFARSQATLDALEAALAEVEGAAENDNGGNNGNEG